MSNTCPICESEDTILLRKDVKSGVPPHMQKDQNNIKKNGRANIKLYRCNKCVLDFLETWDDPEKVYKFYKDNNYVAFSNVVDGKLKFNEARKRVERVLPYVDKNTRLLDIGCGNGRFLDELRKHVGTVEGLEITAEHVESCNKKGIKVWDCFLEDFHPEKPFDAVVLHATLEHIAKVKDFIIDLKRVIHDKSYVFIEVPSLRDPLANTFDIEPYREFFYREYHLYYFSEISLAKLFANFGFKGEVKPELMASLSNHFHWMSFQKGQPNINAMVNMELPSKLINSAAPNGKDVMSIFDEIDDIYREKMIEAGLGDMLLGRFSLT